MRVKYILAISGGVDSMALLDMIVKGNLPSNFHPEGLKDAVVAHYDHGIRENSAADAELVRKAVEKYQMKFVLGRGHLGKNASEELARAKRYEFFRSLFNNNEDCKIVTAHHQDDLLETMLMNLIRGTGWRGLAPLRTGDILRPLLNLTKAEIVSYAIENNLEWADDETNYSSRYFRNRVRDITSQMSATQRKRLLELQQKQAVLRDEIESLLDSIPVSDSYQIKDVTDLPDDLAVELLRKIVGGKLTTPQLERLLKSLKNLRSGDICQPGGGLEIHLYRGRFTISWLPKKSSPKCLSCDKM